MSCRIHRKWSALTGIPAHGDPVNRDFLCAEYARGVGAFPSRPAATMKLTHYRAARAWTTAKKHRIVEENLEPVASVVGVARRRPARGRSFFAVQFPYVSNFVFGLLLLATAKIRF